MMSTWVDPEEDVDAAWEAEVVRVVTPTPFDRDVARMREALRALVREHREELAVETNAAVVRLQEAFAEHRDVMQQTFNHVLHKAAKETASAVRRGMCAGACKSIRE